MMGDQRAKLAGAVDAGGFLDGLRQLFKECLHHKQIVLGDHQGNDLTPEGVEQIQGAHKHIDRHRTTVKQHGEYIQKQDDPPPPEILLGQRISGHGGDGQRQRRAYDGNKQAVAERRKKELILKNVFVRFQLKAYRQDPYLSRYHRRARREGFCQKVQEWDQTGDADECQKQSVQRPPQRKALLFLSSLHGHHRLLPVVLRLMALQDTSITKPTIDSKMPSAVPVEKSSLPRLTR